MSNLSNLLDKCSDCYYNTGEFYTLTNEDKAILENYDFEIGDDEVVVTDELYDIIQNKLQVVSDNARDGVVGAEIREHDSRKVQLPVLMPSLNECKESEVRAWIDEMEKTFPGLYNEFNTIDQPNSLICMPKFDGVSFLVHYNQGKLKAAYTRGNGMVGQDMTSLAKAIKSIPNEIPTQTEYYMRGELILRNDLQLKEQIEQETGKTFKNLRNLVSGQVNTIGKRSQVFLDNVDFIVYKVWNTQLIQDNQEEMVTIFQAFQDLRKLDINCANVGLIVYCDSINLNEKLQDYVKSYKDWIYDCDGIVLTRNCFTTKTDEPTSATNTNPKGYIKYKQTGEDTSVEAEVNFVEWRISKCGYLKPRVHLKPLELGGVTVTHATGFNYLYIKEKEIGAGTKVKIKRAGDVIPHIVNVVSATKAELPIQYDYEVEGVDAKLKTNNTEEQQIKQLCYFFALFGVEQAGEANIRKLWQAGAKNIYQMSNQSLLETVLGANGKKMFNDLYTKCFVKEVDPAKFLAGLGVFGRGVGQKIIQSVIKTFPEFTMWGSWSINNLTALDGISLTTAIKLMDGRIKAQHELMAGIGSGWNFDFAKYENQPKRLFSDRKVVFTGFRDEQLKNDIEATGAVVLNSLTKACNLVVAKDVTSHSSKIEKARQLGIDVVTIEMAKQMFGI